MKELLINHNDFYKVDGVEYFKFVVGNRIYRDINVDLGKNQKWILEIIAEVCELDYKGLKKKNLLDLIENSNCLKMALV